MTDQQKIAFLENRLDELLVVVGYLLDTLKYHIGDESGLDRRSLDHATENFKRAFLPPLTPPPRPEPSVPFKKS